MRKNDPNIQRQQRDNACQTYLNGMYTDEFEQIVPLCHPSAHPTGREKNQTYDHYQHPFHVKMRAMLDKYKQRIDEGLKKRLEKK